MFHKPMIGMNIQKTGRAVVGGVFASSEAATQPYADRLVGSEVVRVNGVRVDSLNAMKGVPGLRLRPLTLAIRSN